MPRVRFLSRAIVTLCLVLMCVLPPAPAAAQENDPVAMMGKLTELAKLGKFDEAIEVAERLLGVIEKMAGKRHPLYIGQIASLGDLYTLKGDNAQALQLHSQALKLREEVLGREHADVAASLASLATVQINLARFDEAEIALRRALAIREKVLPRSDPNYGFTFVNLGRLHMMRSRLFEAEKAFQRALDLFRRHLPPDHLYLPTTINNLAEAKRALGRFTEAEALLREALATAERIYGPEAQQTAVMINNLGQLHRQYGRYAEAESLMRRELAITERTLGPQHPSIAVSLNNLGTLMTLRGRARDAETLLRRALEVTERQSGAEHPNVAMTLNNLGDALIWQGKADEAERMFRRSLAIRERVYGPENAALAPSLDNLVSHLFARDRVAEAEALARRALSIRTASLPADHPEIGISLSNLATILDKMGRHDQARDLHQKSVALREAALGRDHPEVAQSLNNLGGNRLDGRDWEGAYASFKRGAEIWLGRRNSGVPTLAAQPGDNLDNELKRFVDPFLGLIWAAYELGQNSGGKDRNALSEESFAALQWASVSEAADAVAKLSARIAAGSGALSGLVRERQDLAASLDAIDRSVIAAISSAPEQRSKEAETDLRRKTAALAAQLKAIDAELNARFPEFAQLAQPEPRSIAQLQRTLKPNEALYTVALTRGGGFAWAITRDDVRWFHVPRTHKEVEDDVAALRCGVDPAAWEAPASRCADLTKQTYTEADRMAGRLPRFDLDRAYALYRALFGEAEDLIKGRQLVIMPTGALTRLPFHLLVIEKPAPAASDTEAYRRAAWLARRTPIVILPTLGALETLRGRLERRTGGGSAPYFAMGNPLLDGPDARYASLAQAARDQQSCARLYPSDAPQSLRGTRALASSVITSAGVADPGFLRKQPPLPETAFELCTVASRMGQAANASVLLGRDASEATIKALDRRGELKKYSVLHFATHGAMAGEVVGSAEPGLLLTPPATASAAEDGYLAASEIALFKLDADLVILSACNTAAGGEDNADETLSGLARSFFYAGAQALFVSHWAVDSAATVRLITVALAEGARDPAIGHAEALRRAMLELIDKGGAGEVHPAAWAPFVVVGGAG
jgi:CHAT domain-containing protein/Tfp pilus assembly protein PilF